MEEAVVGAVQTHVTAFLSLEVHEVLERVDAVFARVFSDLLEMGFVRGAEMKSEINVSSGFARLFLVGEDVYVALVLEKVRDDRRDAALGGVGRFRRIFLDRFGEAEVDVGVDETREHEAALCIDGVVIRQHVVPGLADRGDPTVLDRDVGRQLAATAGRPCPPWSPRPDPRS